MNDQACVCWGKGEVGSFTHLVPYQADLHSVTAGVLPNAPHPVGDVV